MWYIRIGLRITCIPSHPLLLYKQIFTEGRAMTPIWHTEPWYSSHVNRNTSYPLMYKQSFQRSFRERTSFDHQQNSKVSGMENLRKRLSLSAVSVTASSLIAELSRNSSTGNYESVWRKWVGWCRRRQIDPVSCNITQILVFPRGLFGTCYEYRTINSHKSAISSYRQNIDVKGVGSNDKVCILLSGVFNLYSN